MRTGRPARLKTFSYRGFHRYSLTYCTSGRQKLFERADAVELVRSEFLRVAERERFSILAYCFMPDHVHMIVEGLRADSDGKQFIAKSKQFSGYAYAKKFGERLWQHWAYEHVIRDEEDVPAKVRYVLENPVRAGLVQSVLDYPFVGSQVYDLKEMVEGLPQTWFVGLG
jgi:REP element-mobilizing transposase RayT